MAEQPEKKEVIKLLAYSLQRLAKLYQVPNWDENNAVFLAEWIYENYKYDSLDDVMVCLINPPDTGDKNWRLTPDTIREWMAIQLDKVAARREKELELLKQKELEPLDKVDYEAFKDRINREGLPEKKRGWEDSNYIDFRNKYLSEKMKSEVSGSNTKNS